MEESILAWTVSPSHNAWRGLAARPPPLYCLLARSSSIPGRRGRIALAIASRSRCHGLVIEQLGRPLPRARVSTQQLAISIRPRASMHGNQAKCAARTVLASGQYVNMHAFSSYPRHTWFWLSGCMCAWVLVRYCLAAAAPGILESASVCMHVGLV